MNDTHDPYFEIVFWTVVVTWFAFAAAFLFRKRPPRTSSPKQKMGSWGGILLAGVGMAIVWWVRRPWFSPIVPLPFTLQIALDGLTLAIVVGSAWITMAAVRVLGRQWNVTATLVEGHTLITNGPYGIVRHPIYLGMFGMMIATGLANSYWYAVLVAACFAIVGTLVRVHYEEQLLRGSFGEEFDKYTQSVPAFIPRVFVRKG